MTLKECTAMLAPLAISLGHSLDDVGYRAYHQGLSDVPLVLLQAACETARMSPREPYEPRFPTVPKLREWATAARAKLLPEWDGCEACKSSRGWVEIEEDGVSRVKRCGCFVAHLDKVQRLGLGAPLVQKQIEAVRDEAWV